MVDSSGFQSFSPATGIYGLPFTREYAKVILLPVPWEVTTSYGGGTAKGPEAILQASPQIDLYDIDFPGAFEQGIFMEPVNKKIATLNKQLRQMAQTVINGLEEWHQLPANLQQQLKTINDGCRQMTEWVYEETKRTLEEGKIPAVVGGDHSSPLGAIKALTEIYPKDFGVLHVDAHADLRKAYQGFEQSHASIMYNVMNLKNHPERLVQVAIRDFCQEEFDFQKERKDEIRCFFDRSLKTRMFEGHTWSAICQEVISELPQNVYVSFDIDGLSPEFCPHTGTPVPGGLTFDQAVHLLATLGKSGRKIVGFDLNEVAPDEEGVSEWDGNVGARLLYKLCGLALSSPR